MNGTELNNMLKKNLHESKLKDHEGTHTSIMLPNQKKRIQAKKQNIKLILCVLISNLFIYMIMTILKNDNPPVPQNIKSPIKSHPDFSKIRIPLKLFVPVDNKKSEIPISIYSKTKKLLIKKAYLRLDLSTQKKQSSFSDLSESELKAPYYVVEIPDSQLPKIINIKDQTFIAYPFTEYPVNNPAPIMKRNLYEITF